MPFIPKSTLKLTSEQLDVTLSALRNAYTKASKPTQAILKEVITEVAVGGSAQNVRGPGRPRNAQPKRQTKKRSAKKKAAKKTTPTKSE